MNGFILGFMFGSFMSNSGGGTHISPPEPWNPKVTRLLEEALEREKSLTKK